MYLTDDIYFFEVTQQKLQEYVKFQLSTPKIFFIQLTAKKVQPCWIRVLMKLTHLNSREKHKNYPNFCLRLCWEFFISRCFWVYGECLEPRHEDAWCRTPCFLELGTRKRWRDQHKAPIISRKLRITNFIILKIN